MEAKSEIEKVVGFKLPDKPDTGVVVNESLLYAVYKAGQEDVKKLTLPYFQVIAEHNHKAGMRKVVEWMNENVGYNGMTTLDEKWQAKLKEWGIENGS